MFYCSTFPRHLWDVSASSQQGWLKLNSYWKMKKIGLAHAWGPGYWCLLLQESGNNLWRSNSSALLSIKCSFDGQKFPCTDWEPCAPEQWIASLCQSPAARSLGRHRCTCICHQLLLRDSSRSRWPLTTQAEVGEAGVIWRCFRDKDESSLKLKLQPIRKYKQINSWTAS